MKRILVAGALALAVFMAPQAASAAPITGGVDIIGFNATPDGGLDWDDPGTTGVIFNAPGLTGNGNGSFVGTDGSVATFTDFTFNPVDASTPFQIWTFDSGGLTYNFVIETISSFLQSSEANTSTLQVFGTGVFSISGGAFDPTPGNWVFTANSANGQQFSFSSSQAVVPEPAMLALFGLGLLGVARRYTRQ